MFKKPMPVFALLAFLAAGAVFSQEPVPINTAISNAANLFAANLPSGISIAVISITSDSTALSDYVINQLNFNLVNAGVFQVAARGLIELQAAGGEIGFSMTEFVADDAQVRIGHAIGADTIVTGTVSRETSTTFRLLLNAIYVEGLIIRSMYSSAVIDDEQMATLIGGPGFVPPPPPPPPLVLIEDYSLGERFQMAGLNTIFGLGSIRNGHRAGWATAVLQFLGITSIVLGQTLNPASEDGYIVVFEGNRFYNPDTGRMEIIPGTEITESNWNREDRQLFTTLGLVTIGTGVVFGWIIPFVHTKAGAGFYASSVADNPLPFNIELVSTNNRDINGVRIMHKISF
ncbi:MAG: hypothetical protein FWG66_13275 [Spirochaetes bacterium]|nr:hypothetical protein [Spirochaetota bacterium]